MGRRGVLSGMLVILLSGPAPAYGQNLKQIREALLRKFKGQTLLLRGYYSGAELAYDSDGKLVRPTPMGTWTLDGHVNVRKLDLKANLLDVRGIREFERYDVEKKKWSGLAAGPLRIEISLSQGDLSVADLDRLMNDIFITGASPDADLIPSYWRGLTSDGERVRLTNDDGDLGGEPVRKASVKNGVSSPLRLQTPDPGYTDEARAHKVQGGLVLAAVIGKDGRVADVAEVSAPLAG